MKNFHIINVGVSIIANLQRAEKVEKRPVSDNTFWREKLDDPNFLNEVYEFVKEDPMKNSAELNSFLRIVEKLGGEPEQHEVYLVGTKTPVNEICVRTLERFLKEKGYVIYNPKEVSAYFWEAEKFSEKHATEEFIRDVATLIDRLIYLAKKKKEEGYNVYFNPTGGMKAHVIACALAGFLVSSPVYYIHEEFQDVVKLPDVLYIPKGKEIELLDMLSDKEPVSGHEFKELQKRYKDEIERLALYGLVEVEENEEGEKFRIRITNKGVLMLEKLK